MNQPCPAPVVETRRVNGIQMRFASQGSGPLVLLCHGFPESWYSWRHQMAALSEAGWRAVAPDMRGYGGTDAPTDPSAYTMLHHVGDMVELIEALGESHAVIVGHDWGAPVAWTAALLRPDLFRAVIGMSVPYAPPSGTDLLTALEKRGVHTFYMQYFQAVGVAEAELEKDVGSTIRRLSYSLSGEGPAGPICGVLEAGAGFLDNTVDPETLPSWLEPGEIQFLSEEFARTGFRGGLNWYRSLRTSAELLVAWKGKSIGQPSLFIAGSRDEVLRFPGALSRIEGLAGVLPGLRGCHILEGAGHWIQRERALEVNHLVLSFLRGL